MNTATYQSNNSVSTGILLFCFAFPSIAAVIILPTSSGLIASALLTLTVLLWFYAASRAYTALQEGAFELPVWNMVALVVASLFMLQVGSGTAVRVAGWLAAIQAAAYLAAIAFFRSQQKRGRATRAPFASQGPKRGSAQPVAASDDADYLRAEQKLIAQERHAVRPAQNFQNTAEVSKHTFKSIIGMDDLKARLYAAYKEMFTSVTTKGADKKNGILLYGEPGNGKTFIAESMAGAIGWPIIKATFGDVNSSWVGQTTERVVQLFDDAMAQAPCVLFIDEIDALLVKRDKIMQAESETSKTVNTILTKLVELREHMVLVVAATNFLDRLDVAAIREGRFDYKIEVTPPDLAARKGLLLADLKKHAPAAKLDMDSIDRIARRWEGFSVARIKGVAYEAAKVAKRAQRDVDFDCLMTALRTVQGSLGERLPENAKTIDQMQFDDDVRATLNGLAVRMRDIDEIERLGGSVPSGVLFYGPPGTGKTATVRALAKSSGWALLTTSGKDLNASEGKIDEIFQTARNIRPVIVFIDEADDVLADRQTSWNKSMTNKLLSVIDGAGGKSHDILWVAATNHPDAIDSAALRGGRFTEKVEFRLPSVTVIEGFVRAWDEKNPASIEAGLTYADIATRLEGQSIANIEAIMQSAVNHMISRTVGGGVPRMVNASDIEAAHISVVGE